MVEQSNAVYFDNFVPKVAKGRNLSPDTVNSIGQGRVWTGTQGKANGLVDDFGGLEKAISVAKELAGLPADKDVRRVVFPVPKPFFETFFDTEDSSVTASEKAQAALLDGMPADVRRAFRYASLLDHMQRGEAMLLLPYELEIK